MPLCCHLLPFFFVLEIPRDFLNQIFPIAKDGNIFFWTQYIVVAPAVDDFHCSARQHFKRPRIDALASISMEIQANF